jgi:phospholipid/cholesterol/gamma-HCH transport system substrate-binding protein
MNSRNAVTYTAAVKLGVFTVASVLVTGLLTVIMGHIGLGSTHEYKAMFTTASQLKKGDDVRVAGVSVGQVKDVEVAGQDEALVTFTARTDVPLTVASRAEIRYLNLVGDRYLALLRGRPGAPRLQPGATIPVRLTKPALNLTVLFNGFQPLFAALDPHQVNELSLNLVRTLQGEGGTVQGLLANTASLTSSLADRDQLIGQVIDNLDTMLKTVDDRHRQLDTLVVGLKNWMGQLARDRQAIGSSIHNVSQLTSLLAGLLTQGRPLLKADVAQLRELATRLAQPGNQQIIRGLLDRLPEMLTDQTRTGTYGSWYNYYLCDFKGTITLPALKGPGVAQLQQELTNITFHSTAARCQR